MSKHLLYNISKILFRWSLIYFIILIFLEDVKKSFVTSHFSPHLFIPLIIITGLVVFLLSGQNSFSSETTRSEANLNKKDIIVIFILSLLAGVLTVKLLAWGIIGWIAGVLAFIFTWLATRLLAKEIY